MHVRKKRESKSRQNIEGGTKTRSILKWARRKRANHNVRERVREPLTYETSIHKWGNHKSGKESENLN